MSLLEKVVGGKSLILTDTDAAQINKVLLNLPGARGAGGLVFTVIVICTPRTYDEALTAAVKAGQEHPARILLVVRTEAEETRLDAEICTSEEVPDAIVTLRLSGQVQDHAASVILPLLLPDLPAVVWWPGSSPTNPAQDPIGRLVTYRITDLANSDHPIEKLIERARTHESGTTDLSWSRLTRWRGLLANALDQVKSPIIAAKVEAPHCSIPAELMAAWLESRLGITTQRTISTEPQHICIQLESEKGPITIMHCGDDRAMLSTPGQQDRPIVLHLRTPDELLIEELRRLDCDTVFDETMKTVWIRHERGEV